jgi:hypothetical protein
MQNDSRKFWQDNVKLKSSRVTQMVEHLPSQRKALSSKKKVPPKKKERKKEGKEGERGRKRERKRERERATARKMNSFVKSMCV